MLSILMKPSSSDRVYRMALAFRRPKGSSVISDVIFVLFVI